MTTQVFSRRQVLGGIAVVTGGVMGAGLADQLGGPGGQAQPVLKVGTVVSSPAPTAEFVWVEIVEGQNPLEMPYVAGYTPVPGDRVQVLMLSTGGTMQGLVIGGRAGQAGNLVANADFSRHPYPQITTSRPPYLWAQHTASGQAAVVAGILNQIAHQHVMLIAISNGIAGVNYAYSSPFAVTPAETLAFDTTWEALVFAGTPTTLTVSLRVGWFNSADAIWPDYLSESTIASNSTNFPGGDPFWQTGTAAVPAGATHARVAIRASQSGGDLNYTLTVGRVEANRSTS